MSLRQGFGPVAGKLLVLVAVLAPCSGNDFCPESAGGRTTCKKDHRGPTTATLLLQVTSRTRRGAADANTSVADLRGSVPDELLVDDGSQVSALGPSVKLEDALRLFARKHPIVLSQSGSGNSTEGANQGLGRIAVIYVSGRTTFDDALHEAVLRYTPMGDIFKTKGKVTANFIEALDYAFEKFPNAQWYYIADDDSFVHLARLARLAGSLNATENLYVGKRDCHDDTCKGATAACQRKEMHAGLGMPGWACGGPGVLLSRPLAEAMVQRRCKDYYSKEPSPVNGGDLAMACCAFDAWEGFQIHDMPYFEPGNFTGGFVSTSPLVAIHKLKPDVTRRLGAMYNSPLAA